MMVRKTSAMMVMMVRKKALCDTELLTADLSNDGEEQSPLKAIGKRTSGRHEKTSTAISK